MENKTEKLTPEQTQETVTKARKVKGKAIIDKKNNTLEKLKIQYVKIDRITPNTWNPNRQSEHDFELLCKSMEEDGFTQPIICHKDSGVIVDGEHRWRAAVTLGYKEIPVVYVDMPIEQMKISTIRHNRARGSHDIELEAEILRDLQKLGALDWAKDSLILDDAELNALLNDIEAPEAMASEEYSEAWEPEKFGDDAKIVQNLRESAEGDTLSTTYTQEAVMAQRNRERLLKEAKTDEEKQKIKAEVKLYRLSLVFSGEEAEDVKTALGDSPATKILELCRTYLKSLNQNNN